MPFLIHQYGKGMKWIFLIKFQFLSDTLPMMKLSFFSNWDSTRRHFILSAYVTAQNKEKLKRFENKKTMATRTEILFLICITCQGPKSIISN